MISNTSLAFTPLTSAALVPGQTIMLLGIVPNLPPEVYGVPYDVGDTLSASAVFGLGSLTRAIGEVFRQGAPRVLATAIAQESDIPSLFDSLIDTEFDILVPVGLTGNTNRYRILGQVAYQREQRGAALCIVISTDLSLGTSVSALGNNLAAQGAGIVVTPTVPNPLQISRYFVSCPDQLIINPNVPSQYTTSAATSIAGLLSRLRPQDTITNQPLHRVALVGGYSLSDASILANNGYLSLRDSTRRGIVVNYGVTATSTDPLSPIYSPSLHNLTSLRICQYVISSLRDTGEQLVGEPSSQKIQNMVQATLDTLKREGSIINGNFTIDINQVLGQAYITFVLAIPTEIQKISLNARLSYIRSR